MAGLFFYTRPMNEFTVEVKSLNRTETVTLTAPSPDAALNKAWDQNLWAWDFRIITMNGQPFTPTLHV